MDHRYRSVRGFSADLPPGAIQGEIEIRGVRVPFTVFPPKETEAGYAPPFLLYAHGLQSHREWANGIGAELSARGIGLCAYDRPGSGDSPDLSRGDIDRHETFIAAHRAMHDELARRYPASTITWWGNSFGAKLVLAALPDTPSTTLPKVVLTVPGLFFNAKKNPLPFSRLAFLFADEGAIYPSPITEKSGDQGAWAFTGHAPYVEKIRTDEKALRTLTKRFYLAIRGLDRIVAKRAKRGDYRNVIGRVILVKSDPLMDNEKTRYFFDKFTKNFRLTVNDDDPQRGHYVLFTPGRARTLDAIIAFLFEGAE